MEFELVGQPAVNLCFLPARSRPVAERHAAATHMAAVEAMKAEAALLGDTIRHYIVQGEAVLEDRWLMKAQHPAYVLAGNVGLMGLSVGTLFGLCGLLILDLLFLGDSPADGSAIVPVASATLLLAFRTAFWREGYKVFADELRQVRSCGFSDGYLSAIRTNAACQLGVGDKALYISRWAGGDEAAAVTVFYDAIGSVRDTDDRGVAVVDRIGNPIATVLFARCSSAKRTRVKNLIEDRIAVARAG